MSYLTIIIIAVGLAMDVFAVSISYGCSPVKVDFKKTLIISSAFGLFQAGMPLIGWFGGIKFSYFIEGYNHWISFIVLAYIGIKMIYEGLGDNSEVVDENLCESNLEYGKLFILSVATSIDALAVGFSLSLLKYSIVIPVLIIGVVSFVFSFAGVRLGCRLEHVIGKKAEIFGGIILFFIGSKILAEHFM